jgi:PRTRC genetic system protein B
LRETANTSRLVKGSRSLEFFNGQLVLCSRNGAGEQFKFMSPQAVAAAFRNMPFDSGWLSPGVVRCGSTSQGDFALLFIPASVHKIEVEGSRSSRVQSLRVPLPAFLFYGHGKEFRLWATNDLAPAPTSPIFHAPLPNVFENGGICWGDNKPPRPNASTIRAAFDLFISSPFSSHAANGKSRSHQSDVRPLLRSLHGKKTFPGGELLPLHQSAQFIDRLFGEQQDDEGLEIDFIGMDEDE